MNYDLYIACACNWKTRIGAYGYILKSEDGNSQEGQFGYKEASVNTMLIYALLDTIRIIPDDASVTVHTNNKVLLNWAQERGCTNILMGRFFARKKANYKFVYEKKDESPLLSQASFAATRYQKELETEWNYDMIPKYGE